MSRIIQLTDLHIVERGTLAYGVVDTPACLERAVDFIGDLLPKIGPVDGLVITGDLTEHGRPAEYALLAELLLPLEMPLCVLPGNHDDRAAMRAAFTDQPWHRENGPLNTHVKFGDLHLLALDCLVSHMPYGVLGAETLKWLEVALEQIDDEPVIVGLHHPPFKTGIGHMDAQQLRNPDELVDVVARYKGVKMIIAGHVHRYITEHLECCPMMIAPSVAHAVDLDFTPEGPSQFALEPGGFLLHSHDRSTGRLSSQFVPVGPHAGPHSFAGISVGKTDQG